jgi:hypothetical protein
MAQLAGNPQPAPVVPRDAELAQMLERTAKDAEEQMHFHTSQLRMWERVSLAAVAGLDALNPNKAPMAESEKWPVQTQGRF